MKPFIKHISLFLVPVIVYLFFVWGTNPTEQSRWDRVKGNCPKSSCLYNLINDTSANIDVAFIGTSRTLNSVIDTSLGTVWNKKVANLGYCRQGRNLQFHILSLLFSKHSPEFVFIEINQDEDWYGHFDFGNILNTKAVFTSITDKNPKYLRDVRQNFVMKYDLFQREIKNTPYNTDCCSSGYFKRLDKEPNLTPATSAAINTKEQRSYSEQYLEKMIALCAANNCKVRFVYLPTFGLLDYPPHYLNYYLQFGEIIYPPAELNAEKYWSDKSHFTGQASIIFTNHLAHQLSLY